MKAVSSLKHLFVSVTRQKLINILFYLPNEIYYVRQLVRLSDEEINSVRRELENLKNASLIQMEKRGNRLYYWANQESPVFTILITIAHQSANLCPELVDGRNHIGPLKYIFYSYRFMLGEVKTPDDIDMILVGQPSLKELESQIKIEEKLRGREINYMVMDKDELQLRRSKRDPFIVNFFLNYPVLIYGNPKDLPTI